MNIQLFVYFICLPLITENAELLKKDTQSKDIVESQFENNILSLLRMNKQQISELMKKEGFSLSNNRLANRTNKFHENIQFIKIAQDTKNSETYNIEFMKGIKTPISLLFTTGKAQTFAGIEYSIKNRFHAIQKGFKDEKGQLDVYYLVTYLNQSYSLKFTYHGQDNGTSSKADDVKYYTVLINTL